MPALPSEVLGGMITPALLMREAWGAVVSTLAETEYARELAAKCQERSDG